VDDAYVTTSKVRAAAASATGAITSPAAGNLLCVVIISQNSNSANHTCSDNQSNQYTKAGNIDNGTAGGISLWYVPNVFSAGTFNVTVGSPSALAVVGLVTEFAGALPVAPTDGTAVTNTGNASTVPTASKTPTFPDGFGFAGMGNNGGATAAVQVPTNGWNRAGQEPDGATYMVSESAYILYEDTRVQSTSWTWTGTFVTWNILQLFQAALDVPAPLYSGGRYPSVAAIRTANVL
jgi:hypothetical protein